MTTEEKQALQDLKAFIEFAINEDMPFFSTLGTIGHDVRGLYDQDETFLPRTHGYFKRCAQCGEDMYGTIKVHSHTEKDASGQYVDVTEKKI